MSDPRWQDVADAESAARYFRLAADQGLLQEINSFRELVDGG